MTKHNRGSLSNRGQRSDSWTTKVAQAWTSRSQRGTDAEVRAGAARGWEQSEAPAWPEAAPSTLTSEKGELA